MKRVVVIVIALLLSMLGREEKTAWAMETYTEEIDVTEVQAVMEEILEDASFDFKKAMQAVLEGEEIITPERMLTAVTDTVRRSFIEEKEGLARILVIAVAGAVFVNFSNVFKSSSVAEVSFFVTYLLLFSAMSTSFFRISRTAMEALSGLLEFMKVLLPSYFMAVTFATGSAVSFAFYEVAMMLIWVGEYILVNLVLPLIHIYFVVSLVNYISKEDFLSKTADLLETLIHWITKSILGMTVGYNVVQGMMAPVADYMKRSVVLKTARLLPGIGNAIGSVAESVFGAGILVKNAMGTVGIMVIICIMAVPFIKIGSYCLLYKLGTAVIQPISDKRILECLEGTGKGAALLLYVTFAGAAMFLLTIAIIMASTNHLLA